MHPLYFIDYRRLHQPYNLTEVLNFDTLSYNLTEILQQPSPVINTIRRISQHPYLRLASGSRTGVSRVFQRPARVSSTREGEMAVGAVQGITTGSRKWRRP